LFWADNVVFLEPQKAEPQQQDFKSMSERKERTSVNAGVFMGGGGLIGADLEFLLSKRVALQMGAGWGSMGFGINYHFKPQINSMFASFQYAHLGFGENKVGSTIGPMYVFRAKKIFQAGIGYGVVVSKGKQWENVYNENVSTLLYFNIGLYFPQ
jgi:hypothetical protein